MNEKSEWVEIGALWEKQGTNGGPFLSGSLTFKGSKKPLVVRAIANDKRTEKSPSHRIMMPRTEAEAIGLTINERVQTPAAPKEPTKKIVQPTMGKIGFPNFQEDDLPF